MGRAAGAPCPALWSWGDQWQPWGPSECSHLFSLAGLHGCPDHQLLCECWQISVPVPVPSMGLPWALWGHPECRQAQRRVWAGDPPGFLTTPPLLCPDLAPRANRQLLLCASAAQVVLWPWLPAPVPWASSCRPCPHCPLCPQAGCCPVCCHRLELLPVLESESDVRCDPSLSQAVPCLTHCSSEPSGWAHEALGRLLAPAILLFSQGSTIPCGHSTGGKMVPRQAWICPGRALPTRLLSLCAQPFPSPCLPQVSL